MYFYFISISSLSFFPVFKYILECFINSNINNDNFYLVESHLKGFPSYSSIVNTRYFHQFKSIDDFNNMSLKLKIKRYVWAFYYIMVARLKKKSIIYTSDFQVLFIAFTIFKLLGKSNVKLIYHQYELIQKKGNNDILSKITKNIKFIDLVIIPEINRLNYFVENTHIATNKTLLFPNTCKIENNITNKHSYLKTFNENDIIIAHIGNIGFNHFLKEFINHFNSQRLPDNYKLIFIGKQSAQVRQFVSKENFKNIYFFNEIPHDELSSVYNYIDYGLILYKPVDLNFENCAPNKLYEYWAHGVPVIAHKLKGLQGLITDEMGNLVDFFNLNEFDIKKLTKLSELKRNKIKHNFSINFDVQNFNKELENKLKKIIA
ncbi:MAG: glycosyltransferase [Bacteroidia bacterium]